MTRAILLSSAALLAMGVSAMAADLPTRRAPPVFVPAPPAFSWTGFYVGGQIGYGFGRDNASIDATGQLAPPLGGPFPYSGSPSGIVGGAHVGYNYALTNAPIIGGSSGLVVGVEGDVDGSDYRVTEDFGLKVFPPAPAGVAIGNTRLGIQGSARGRLGIAVDRALFYVTGGAAFGDFTTSYNTLAIGLGAQSFSHVRVGYTIGGGAEYAITPNWSLRAEYRYSDFGRFTDTTTTVFAFPGVLVRHHETVQRVQVGFSYKFDSALVPVVARY